MASLTAETVWGMNEKELLTILESEVLTRHRRRIQFYAPSFTYYKTRHFCSSTKDFPTISVTGNTCALNCKHCAGKVLETMHPADTPKRLLNLCSKFKQNGAKGVLISGGCLPDGSVPLQEFVPAIAKIKKELGLTVFVHTGLVTADLANHLKITQVDAALIDVIGSNETIKEVYNLNTTVQDYADSLQALSEAAVNFVPHVITGLHYGTLKGELDALNTIARHKPSAVVIISFMPIHGTVMAQTKPPEPIDIARTVAIARIKFQKTPIVLGCMRPKGKHRSETDVLALKAGVDGVAFPSEAAIRYVERKGFTVGYSSFCCAQIYRDLLTK
jgi:uncharacterized radical SAM superfamily protein